MKPNQITNLIRSRRSIYPKNYTKEKVDGKIISEMLENANWAPTHRYTEPWRFIVYEGEGIRKFSDYQSLRYKEKTEKEGNFDLEKFNKLQNKPMACSHIIAICMKRDPKETVPEIEEIAAVSCAVQNMWLTATAYGLGSYWSTGGVTYDDEAKDFFGLGAKDRLMGFFMIGIPDKEYVSGRRRPIEDKVLWVK